MKQLFLIILSFFVFGTYAQNTFDWVTAGQSLSMNYIDLQATSDGGVIAIAQKNEVNYTNDEVRFVQGNGRDYEGRNLTWNEQTKVMVQFNAQGTISWVKAIQPQLVEFHDLTLGLDGYFYVLVEIFEYEQDQNGTALGYLGELSSGYDQPYEIGFSILKFDAMGNLKRVIQVQDLAATEDFTIEHVLEYQNNQLLISGFMGEGKLLSDSDASAASGGGSYVMLINQEGTPQWADIISIRYERCCTTYPENISIAVSEEGAIYHAGTYRNGAIFSNGKQFLAPGKYTESSNSASEAYVMSYSPKGKINWIRTEGSLSRMHKIAANNDGVYVSHSIQGPKSFGIKVDTTGGYQDNVFTFINQKGKVTWNNVTKAQYIHDLDVNSQGELIVTGQYKKLMTSYHAPGTFGTLSMKKREEIFAVTLNSKGEYISLWSENLFSSSNEPVLLALGPQDTFFLSLEMWCTLSLGLDMIHDELPELNCYGGTPFLGKIHTETDSNQ